LSCSYAHTILALNFAGLTLRNRVAMPPMWSGKATPEGFVTPAIVEYHRVRAAAGTGLIIVEHSFVDPQGRHSEHAARRPRRRVRRGAGIARRRDPRRRRGRLPADFSRPVRAPPRA